MYVSTFSLEYPKSFEMIYFHTATTKPNPPVVDSIKFKVIAKLEDVAVELQNETRSIAILEIQNLQAGVSIKSSCTDIKLKLQDIIVTDRNPDAVHSKVCLNILISIPLFESNFCKYCRFYRSLAITPFLASWYFSIWMRLLPTILTTCTLRSQWDVRKSYF